MDHSVSVLGIQRYNFITDVTVSARTGISDSDISAVIRDCQITLFGHARRLSPAVSAREFL